MQGCHSRLRLAVVSIGTCLEKLCTDQVSRLSCLVNLTNELVASKSDLDERSGSFRVDLVDDFCDDTMVDGLVDEEFTNPNVSVLSTKMECRVAVAIFSVEQLNLLSLVIVALLIGRPQVLKVAVRGCVEEHNELIVYVHMTLLYYASVRFKVVL